MSSTTADAAIDTQKQLEYWNSVDATADGMLGGFERVTRVDLLGSRTFFAKLRIPRPAEPPYHIADCGAGIGRITKGYLSKINSDVVVDVIEPVKKFTDQVREGVDWEEEGRGKLGEIVNEGLETWTPQSGKYWVIWNQWCLGHLKDAQLVEYLRRCKEGLVEGGVIVVKENISVGDDDEFDEVDSSVTRTEKKFRECFKEAGLKLIKTEVQRGMPAGLFPVRSFALQ